MCKFLLSPLTALTRYFRTHVALSRKTKTTGIRVNLVARRFELYARHKLCLTGASLEKPS